MTAIFLKIASLSVKLRNIEKYIRQSDIFRNNILWAVSGISGCQTYFFTGTSWYYGCVQCFPQLISSASLGFAGHFYAERKEVEFHVGFP